MNKNDIYLHNHEILMLFGFFFRLHDAAFCVIGAVYHFEFRCGERGYASETRAQTSLPICCMRPSHSLSRPQPPTVGMRTTSGSTAPMASPAPPAAASVSRQSSARSNFDDDFGDGSELMDVDVDLAITSVVMNAPTMVKLEHANSGGYPQQPQMHMQSLPLQPPPHAQAQRVNNPQQLATRSPQISPQLGANTSSTAESIRIRELEAMLKSRDTQLREREEALALKEGEARVLRSKAEALERKRVKDAVDAAGKNGLQMSQATHGGFSSSQMPSSSQYHSTSSRKHEQEAQQRMQHQIDAIKAQKESAEMQMSEYVKENERLRRQQDEMQKQLNQAQRTVNTAAMASTSVGPTSAGSSFSVAHANASSGRSPGLGFRPAVPVTSPMITTAVASPIPAAAAFSPMHISTPSAPAPLRRFDTAQRWQMPQFLADLSDVDLSTGTGQIPLPTPPPPVDVELLAKLWLSLQSASAPALPSPPPAAPPAASVRAVKAEPREPARVKAEHKKPMEDVDATVEASTIEQQAGQLMLTVRAVLSQSTTIDLMLPPLKRLMLTCSAIIQPPSVVTPVPSNDTLAGPIAPSRHTGSPAQPSAGSLAKPTAAGGHEWERSVKVKTEHVATNATAGAAPNKFSSPSPANTGTSSSTRESKQARQLIPLLLQLLHFCASHNVKSARQVFEELSDPPASHRMEKPSAPTSTLSPSISSTAFLASTFAWRAPPASPPSPPPFASAAEATAALQRYRLEEAASWKIVMLRLFDDAFARAYFIERAPGLSSSSSSALAAASVASAASLTVIESIIDILRICVSLGTPRLSVQSPTSASFNALSIGLQAMYTAWLPRFAHLLHRIHANAATKHPIQPSNAPAIEASLHRCMAAVVSRWTNLSVKPLLMPIQPVSAIAVPGLVRSTAVEASSPCSCSIVQLLLLHCVRRTAETLSHGKSPTKKVSRFSIVDPLPSWEVTLTTLLDSAHRSYSAHAHLSSGLPCPVHGRDWGERDLEAALFEHAAALFGVPLGQWRLLLSTIHDSASQLQRCTQSQVASICSGDLSCSPHTCTLEHLAIALRAVEKCLQIRQRTWRALQADPAWAGALTATRSESALDLRLDTMMLELQETCVAIRQSQQQLHAASPQVEKRIRIGSERAWAEVTSVASEFLTWFNSP